MVELSKINLVGINVIWTTLIHLRIRSRCPHVVFSIHSSRTWSFDNISEVKWYFSYLLYIFQYFQMVLSTRNSRNHSDVQYYVYRISNGSQSAPIPLH